MTPIATFDPTATRYPVHLILNESRETLTPNEALHLAAQLREAARQAKVEKQLKEYSNECTN